MEHRFLAWEMRESMKAAFGRLTEQGLQLGLEYLHLLLGFDMGHIRHKSGS